uniref:Dickkopf WNT signaling pathway inhibitor 3 n=1 Tax=Myripristis murdjan TaxID=586833 RepID=A0A667XGH4_9TELE
MAGTVLSLAAVLALSVGLLVSGGPVGNGLRDLEDLERGPVSLNDMFREVEMLMEDTQHILEEAVDQVSPKCFLNWSCFWQTPFPLTGEGESNQNSSECMVDEDCGDLRYCMYGIEKSRCLPCIPTDMPCTKDEECCSDEMCVWGQCTANATRGAEGTICQVQSDCRADLCCAFQRELLFPVCNPKPEKGESCLSHPNLLMDMLAWDQEGPRDHCPCANELQCQGWPGVATAPPINLLATPLASHIDSIVSYA